MTKPDSTEDRYQSAADTLKQRGIYYIVGEVESETLIEIHQDILLKHMTPSWKDDIQLVINSPGGSVTEGWAFIDLLRWVKMDIRTVGMGECSSLGAILLASGTKGKRVATPHTSIMIHGPWIDHMGGNQQQLVSEMKDVKNEFQRHLQFWMEVSKYKTQSEVKKHLLDGFDKYLTPEEAVKHGIVDEIVGPSSSEDNKPVKKIIRRKRHK